MIIFISDNPESIIAQQEAMLLAGNNLEAAFAVKFPFDQYYLAEPTTIELIALVRLKKEAKRISIDAAIFPFENNINNAIAQLDVHHNNLQKFSNHYETPWLTLSAPLMLAPIKIPKPWGQEIWYTGIESRGQSNVIAQGFSTPLPWVLALLPNYLAANHHKKIVLLKTLDPLPEEVYGDLYFELHEEKQEVYIVTHIASQAWSNNTGAIRLGFDQKKRSEYKSDEEFKAAYLNAVNDYEKVRRTIDDLYDGERIKHNIPLAFPVDAKTLAAWAKTIPHELIEREERARHYKNSFSAIHPLHVGDIVKVPCYVPHALQHGVRVIEFQTPVYERKILSFAQKVLTQDHWDTQGALEIAKLAAPEQTKLNVLSEDDEVLVEEVAQFDNFRVIRINLTTDQKYDLESLDSYGLLMPVSNACSVSIENTEFTLAAEAAMFLPYSLLADKNSVIRLHAKYGVLQVLLAIIHN